LILSRYEKLVLLMLLRTLGDGYSLMGSKKKPPRHRSETKGAAKVVCAIGNRCLLS
jgi:hypothetical protein